MTFALLRISPHFYESNPVAMWFFRALEHRRDDCLEVRAVALAIAIGELVERRRPGWGKAVLLIGCLATAAVVAHGPRLYLGFIQNLSGG